MKESTFKKWPLISWEPEILISGGLILALLNIQPYINQLKYAMQPFSIPGFSVFLFVVSLALGGLTVGFIIHLILRALWLMKIGLASVFRKPLDVEAFEFSEVYKKRITHLDIRKSALQLGSASSLVFSISFFFLLLSIGLLVLSTILIGSISINLLNLNGNYAMPVIFGLLLLLFIDFISLGWLKRTKFGKALYPLFYGLYFLSLSFLYRDVYYHLIQNVAKKKLIIGFLLLVSFSMLLGIMNVSEAMRWNRLITTNRYEHYLPNIYEDERKQYSNRPASINSYFQNKNVVRLFLLGHYGKIETAIDNNTLSIKIDDELITPFKTFNHTTDDNQSGYLYFLDIAQVSSEAEHEIGVFIEDEQIVKIPFYKEKN